jgi:hypothetical protein
VSKSLRRQAATLTFHTDLKADSEGLMAQRLIKIAALGGTTAIVLGLAGASASAAPLAAGLTNPVPMVEPAQIFKRGRPPIYPYVYTPPRRPGGWSTYFGFVPYEKGDYEIQALQRLYPQTNWPPSMRYWTPQSGF